MARSTPADYREFIRVSVDLPANPKLAMIDNPAAGWAYVVSLCYCGGNRVPSFPLGHVLRTAGVKRKVVAKLTTAGLWHAGPHDCLLCEQPAEGMAVVHDNGLYVPCPAEGSRPAIPAALRQAVYERDGFACVQCGASSPLSLDHVHPFSKGGSDTFENLQTLCMPCNRRKGVQV